VFLDTGALLGGQFLVGSHVLTLIDPHTRNESCSACVLVDICSPVVGRAEVIEYDLLPPYDDFC